MRILGIDYGTKRIGIAVSDPLANFALPHSVINNDESIIEKISEIAKEQDTKIIVLGESKNYKGEANKILSNTLVLKKDLESRGFTVHFEPEFMTSAQAERFQGKNEHTDASAAALILQSYLDSHKVN